MSDDYKPCNILDIDFPEGFEDTKRLMLNTEEKTRGLSLAFYRICNTAPQFIDDLEKFERNYYKRIKAELEIFRKSKGWPED